MKPKEWDSSIIAEIGSGSYVKELTEEWNPNIPSTHVDWWNVEKNQIELSYNFPGKHN